MYTLDKLWRVGFAPQERYIREGSEYHKISRQQSDIEDKFWRELSAEGKKAFDEYCYKQSELNTLSESDAFVQGFRLGAKIILDVLGEYRSDMPQIRDFSVTG